MSDLRDAVLVLLANSEIELEEYGETNAMGTFIDQSKYNMIVPIDLMDELAAAMGITVSPFEDPWMAIKHAMRREQDEEEDGVKRLTKESS